MTILYDVLFSLGIGLCLAVAIAFGSTIRAIRPSRSEVERFDRAAEIAARSSRMRRSGFLWLVPGLGLIGLRNLPGGLLETLGWAFAIIGYGLLVASVAKLSQWRFPSVRRGP